MKSQNSIMPEDYEEFISLTLRTRNSKKPSRMPVISWTHQLLLLCLVKLRRSIVGVVDPTKSRQNLRVFWKLMNLRDCVWENLHRIIMKTIKIPAAKAAVDKEWEKFEKIPAWKPDESQK